MATSATSAFYNPISWGNRTPKLHPWSYALIAGVATPGYIPHKGIKGFERETGWDKKKGKGTQGATMTLTTQPPAEGTIELCLIDEQDFIDWDAFLQFILYDPTRKKQDAYDIFHPSLAPLRIKSVVIEKIAPLVHAGKGLYTTSLKLCEWVRPPAATVVQTPSKSDPANPAKAPGSPYQAQIDANNIEMRALGIKAGLITPRSVEPTRNSRFDK